MAEPEVSNSQAGRMMEIYESLRDRVIKDKQYDFTINIFGGRGVGKTRMAKKVSERAIREKLFDFTIWVFMCRKYTKDSLCMSIARQLFLIPANEDWEVDDDNVTVQDQDHYEQPNTETLVEKIKAKLIGRATLVVLDDVLDGETKTPEEAKFWSVWNEMLPSFIKFASIVITTEMRRADGENISPGSAFEIKALPREVCNNLLKEYLDNNLPKENTGNELLEKVYSLGKTFLDKFKGDHMPARSVILIAKVLNHFCTDESGVSVLEKQLMEEAEIYSLSKWLCNKHDVLPIGVLKDLWWKGNHFFRDSKSVHYSELITYWILEGYLGVGSMTKLYLKGHDVLMELVDCGVVKLQEGGYVFMDNSLIDVHDLYQFVDQNPNLGLATVITAEKEVFGRISHNDGMLKTTPKRPKMNQASDEGFRDLATNSTLLLDGTCFTETEITELLRIETKLEAFGLFYPTIKSLPKELEMLAELRVLVLRGCDFLESARVSLEYLEVLEISGGRILRRLTSSLFKNMSNLTSLHLSGLQIQALPQAIYKLDNIKWLIVKDCPRLRKFDSISKLTKLIVVDLSGNISLDTLDKNFLRFNKLQTLNLSKTLLSTTPLLKNRSYLTHLLCRECGELDRLRGLKSLTSLQTIDLKGSKKFQEFHDSSLESLTSLITLNLSETDIDRLPSNISKPRYLYLERCLKLLRLPCIKSFENLEVLHLLASSNLEYIEDRFFNDMNRLRVLNLSETKISHLPSFLHLSNLRELYLSRCHELKALPSLESSTKLELLDASQCTALHEIESKSFESMTHLQKIDFSNTNINSFPSLPNPCNLSRLSLKNCKALQDLVLDGEFPNLEELYLSGVPSLKPNGVEFVMNIHTLRILDISHTSIKQLPSFSRLKKLTHLSLAGCVFSPDPQLDYPLIKIEVLDLSQSSIRILPNLDYTNLKRLMLKGCTMKEIPNLISTSSRLEYIEFPNINVTSTPKDVLDQDCWQICELSDTDKSSVFHSPTQLLEIITLHNRPFHLCAVPSKAEGETTETYPQRHELIFRDVYLQTCQFALYKNQKLMQIRGFNQFPKGMFNDIIKDINLVLLIDYKLKGIPSADFNTSMLLDLKGCWIERCNEMYTIFDQEKEPNSDKPWFDVPIEDLGLRNNKRLNRIYGGKQPLGSFDSLKSLYIDNCRQLPSVFSSSWLPKKLEVLEIKYCDQIREFGGDLPQSLQTLKIWECPKLKQLEETFEIPKGLKTLWISGASSLRKFVTKEDDELINLETLRVENCSALEYVMSSSSTLAWIQVINIRSCERIKNVCMDLDNKRTWINLKNLHLEDLPVLEQIGAYFQPIVHMFIVDCPKLQHQMID